MIEALQQTEAKGVAALTLMWLSQEADERGRVSASSRAVSEAIGRTDRATRDALSLLIEMGEIDVAERGKGRKPTIYLVRNNIAVVTPQRPAEPVRRVEPDPPVVRKGITDKPTGGLRATFRKTVSDPKGFRDWCARAPRGDTCIYHVGLIAADRAASRDLDTIALLVQILAGTGFIMPGQHPIALAAGRQVAYTAMRTGAGIAPPSILSGDLDPRDFIALLAIRNRPSDQSAARALRDALGLHRDELAAGNILRRLSRSGWVQRGANAAWDLSPEGRNALRGAA